MNNPPAFPQKRQIYRSGFATKEYEPVEGMTLRDYFAAKAMQGICNSRSHSELKGHAIASAKVAYELADAMIKAREA